MLRVAVLGGLALGAGACAEREAIGTRRAPSAPGTARWAAVMAPASLDEHPHTAWETSRNDLALGVERERALTAADLWPERARPSLFHARRLSLPRSAEQIIYFPRADVRGGGYGDTRFDGPYVGSGRWWWGGD